MPGDGCFVFTPRTVTVADGDDALAAAEALRAALKPATGLPLRLVSAAPSERPGEDAVTVRLDPAAAPEAYRLSVTGRGILLSGARAGLLHGIQTLLQLLPPEIYRRSRVDPECEEARWRAPVVTIEDAPRYAWRGLMIDVARHFVPKHDLLRLIDLAAAHRLNRLHLHLSDDQGWRVEIAAYPRLTEVGAWRRGSQVGKGDRLRHDPRRHGGFYTQAELREVVGYAAERGIDVVPEIDLPGHSVAAIAAYPELGVTSRPVHVREEWGVATDVLNVEESTVRFYCDVFDELSTVFPSPYVGAGGDECPRDQWASDERTRTLMAERGLADHAAVQTWFMDAIAAHLKHLGKRMLAWDEILEGSPDAATLVLGWRNAGQVAHAARRGYDVVACPNEFTYLDARQSLDEREPIPWSFLITLDDAYAFDPVPAGLTDDEARHVIGGQANMWTENVETAHDIDYMLFPRLCAIADALWRTSGPDFDAFRDDLELHLRRLDALGVTYRRASGPLPWQQRPDAHGTPPGQEAVAREAAKQRSRKARERKSA